MAKPIIQWKHITPQTFLAKCGYLTVGVVYPIKLPDDSIVYEANFSYPENKPPMACESLVTAREEVEKNFIELYESGKLFELEEIKESTES